VHGVDPAGSQGVVQTGVAYVEGVSRRDGAATLRIRVDQDQIADIGMRQVQRHEVRPESESQHGYAQAPAAATDRRHLLSVTHGDRSGRYCRM